MWTLKILGKVCFKHYFINSEHNETAISVLLDIIAPNELSYHKSKKNMLEYITGIKKFTLLIIKYIEI